MPSPLYETVKNVFSGENWAFSEVPDREVIQAGFEAHHTRIELHVQIFPELAAVSVIAESNAAADGDAARRERLAELVMRTNQALTVGNFEINWDTSQVFFRATNLFPGEEGDPRIIQGLIHTTIMEMDRLTPMLSSIVRATGSELAGLDIAEMIRQFEEAAAEANS